MCYSMEHWVEATNLKTAVERLSNEFSDLQFDRMMQQNRWHTEEDYIIFRNEEENFERAVCLCRKFIGGHIEIEEFCESLIQIGLKPYLENIRSYLSQELIRKYLL